MKKLCFCEREDTLNISARGCLGGLVCSKNRRRGLLLCAILFLQNRFPLKNSSLHLVLHLFFCSVRALVSFSASIIHTNWRSDKGRFFRNKGSSADYQLFHPVRPGSMPQQIGPRWCFWKIPAMFRMLTSCIHAR